MQHSFQSTRPHKPRRITGIMYYATVNFNPRGHISLDGSGLMPDNLEKLFQSTRPHKPRQQKHTTNIFKPLSQRHYYTTSLKIYHYIITIYLPNPLLFTKNWCESPGKFMCTSDSPLPFLTAASFLSSSLLLPNQPYTSHSSLHIFHPITEFLFPL